MKYLGVTSKQDPYEYMGSGIVWMRHLKKHKFTSFDIATDILLETDDENILQFWGMYYSKIWNIVDDEEWANLIPESGQKSLLGMRFSDEYRHKLSIAKLGNTNMLGKKHSDEAKIKMSNAQMGEKSHMFGKKWSKKMIERLRDIPKNKKEVYKFDLDGNFIEKFKSVAEATRSITNERTSHIQACCIGKRNKTKGFRWSFTNKPNKINKNKL